MRPQKCSMLQCTHVSHYDNKYCAPQHQSTVINICTAIYSTCTCTYMYMHMLGTCRCVHTFECTCTSTCICTHTPVHAHEENGWLRLGGRPGNW